MSTKTEEELKTAINKAAVAELLSEKIVWLEDLWECFSQASLACTEVREKVAMSYLLDTIEQAEKCAAVLKDLLEK